MLKRSLPLAALLLSPLLARAAGPTPVVPAASRPWAHDNLYAWCVVPFDAKHRNFLERAAMLERLGFKSFSYDWRDKDIPTFDAEISALHSHHVQVLAWWFPLEATDPQARATLEVFRRHGVHPQLWVAQFGPVPDAATAEVQQKRVQSSAQRIADLVALAKPYGCPIELYNHNGWFGQEENQLAVLDNLRGRGVAGVGMVYNFSHSRDKDHDDTRDFPALWARIKDHVVAVNVTGLHFEGQHVYPSQGDQELNMMRTIEQSGWHGPVGLIAEKGGDAAITLANYRLGLDWLAAEIAAPGSGGPPPQFADAGPAK